MRLKDRLYIEADNACAACGARSLKALTIHHIDGDPSNNEYENQIVLCHNCHTIHHERKGINKRQVIEMKRRLILKTMTVFGLNALKIADREGKVFAAPFILNHMVDLGYLELVGTSQLGANKDSIPHVVEAVFQTTRKGSRVLKKWRL